MAANMPLQISGLNGLKGTVTVVFVILLQHENRSELHTF